MNDDLISYYNVSQNQLCKITAELLPWPYGDTDSFKEFLWKLSQDKYLLASDALKLHFAKDDIREFKGYLEVSYVDENVVQLANNEAVLQTIAADCIVELNDGVTVNLSEKTIKYYNITKLTLAQMMVDAEENIEVTPLKKDVARIKLPKITTIDGEDGKDGETGDAGEPGEPGEGGQAGDTGETGEDGESGSKGKSGKKGEDGAAGETVGGGGEDENPLPRLNCLFLNYPNGMLRRPVSAAIFIEDEENLLLGIRLI